MRLHHVTVGWLIFWTLLGAARAEHPLDPLRLLPSDADFCITIEQPRRLIESVVTSDPVRQLQAFDAFREVLDSTGSHRFFQLLAYLEKDLGADRWQLLDGLAGGGVALGGKLGPNTAPRLLVIQAKDEKLLRRFAQLAFSVIEGELARQESKDQLEKKTVRDIETFHIGQDFCAALIGSALVISNTGQGLQRAIELAESKSGQGLARLAHIAHARRLIGSDSLGWAWLNMENVRKIPQVKDLFAMPRNEPALTVLVGGWLDVARRAPFLYAGLYAAEHGGLLSVRMPAGREGMAAEVATHIPPAGKPGSRPVLEPKGVLYSSSYYLDIAQIWNARGQLFNEKHKKAFEDFDAKTGPFLAGTRMSKLLTQAGPYQRIVIAHRAKPGYKTAPGQYLPAFAVVLEMREPEALGKTLETILRAAGLLATTQVKLKLFEEAHGKQHIIGYRFSEDQPLRADVNNIRFNFTPCFVTVCNQFVACSDLTLCRELIDLLEKEQATTQQGSPASTQTRVYASGAVTLMEAFKDRLFTKVILDQAIPPDRATEQLQAFMDWVRRLGVMELESVYGSRDFHYDVRLQLAPSGK